MTHRGRQFFLVNWLKKAPNIRSHLVGGAKNAGTSALQGGRSSLRKMRGCTAGRECRGVAIAAQALKGAHELRKLLALNTTGLKRLIRQPFSADEMYNLNQWKYRVRGLLL